MRRSTRLRGEADRNPEINRQFWESVQDPLEIKRERSCGRAEAIVTTQSMTSRTEATSQNLNIDTSHHTTNAPDVTPIPNVTINSAHEEETFPQELTNYSEALSNTQVPVMVYINEEMTGQTQPGRYNPATQTSLDRERSENSRRSDVTDAGEAGSQIEGPLERRFTEPSNQKLTNVTSPGTNEYWEEDYSNMATQHGINSLSLSTLAANIDLQTLTVGNKPDKLENPVMDWIVPDGQNKRLREHGNKAMADTTSPDGGPAMYIDLQSLGPYFSSQNFLIDMNTGQIFVLHKRRWIRTGLNCTQAIYPIEELGREIQEASEAYWIKLREANETSLEQLTKYVKRKLPQIDQQVTTPTPRHLPTAQPPPLPRIDNPNLYTIHDEPMPLCIRRTYIRDRTRNAHTYIMEYSSTLEMEKEKRYDSDELWSRLRIVYGRVNTVRERIDRSLAKDDELRRRKGLVNYRSPFHFPEPAEMHNSTPPTWIQWISREANELCTELTEVIEEETSENTTEFRPIPLDDEVLEKRSQDNNLMQFETPRTSPRNTVEGGGGGKRPHSWGRE